MPSPEILRIDTDDSYYHVYSRGVNKQSIFIEDFDKETFISYIDRYLSSAPQANPSGGIYPNFHKEISVLAYAIMDNHFHFLVHQQTEGKLSKFMQCLLISYRAHCHRTHSFVGPLFQSRYKSKLITEEPYWTHVSKYIHRNPENYKHYEFSSYNYYQSRYTTPPIWLDTETVLSSFGSVESYMKYVDSL